MGCQSSKHKKISYEKQSIQKKQASDGNSGRPQNHETKQLEEIVVDEWLNAIKNENLKEGSLIIPPDDLAKDTNNAITKKNN